MGSVNHPDAPILEPRETWLERIPRWSKRLGTIGTRPEDDEEEILRKASVILTMSLITALATVWVAIYGALGLFTSAAIPFAYQVISATSLLLLARTNGFNWYLRSQMTLMLLLPVLLQFSLGGFVASGGVILWSLSAPLVALVFARRPLPWFVAYVTLLAVSGFAEGALIPASMPVAVRNTFYVLNIGGVSTVVYALLRYFMRGLVSERKKSEALLLNVLPAPIARRLKGGERPLADYVEEAAVLFADLVDFTPLAERMDPDALVELLDELFSRFDAIADRRGLEKIKTVGDAYMIVGGLPNPSPNAAQDVAEMALEMQDLVARLPTPTGEPLRLRIGIDIGPVVAGVIGRRKFSYDLWGDTVNTASRMESHGVAGRIQVTSRAYERLQSRYEFTAREPLTIKGKGNLVPYLLEGRRDSAKAMHRQTVGPVSQ
jgi:class 3 adenylate cyclase